MNVIEELSNLNPPNTEFNNKLMLKALLLLENPQYTYKVIHIAGTNGKGSTAAFLEEGLFQAGYKTGKFSSPHISKINECITYNKVQIDDNTLVRHYLELKSILGKSNIYPSSFEMLTLIMFRFFAEKGIDYLILETGMGGRDDCTNVVNSNYSIITNISLEHTQWLGNSLSEIATHKCGIIKSGLTILGENTPELVTTAKKITSNLVLIDDQYDYTSKLDFKNFTTLLSFSDKENKSYQFELGLFGYFQVRNFLCAYTVLKDLGVSINIIRRAAKETIWLGRLQKISTYPLILADASHNENGTKVLAESLKRYRNKKESIIVCSTLKDKDIDKMLDNYSKISQNIIFCNINNQPRASNPFILAKKARHKFKNIYVVPSPELALYQAKKMKKQLVLISGSIYLLKNYFN